MTVAAAVTVLDALKASCVLVRAPASQGTAYFVSPRQLATCHHVVESAGAGGAVDLLFPGRTVAAKVAKLDEQSDCALLDLVEAVPGTQPLRLAARCEPKALWDGYGFPGLANGAGLPFFGKILDAQSSDDIQRPMTTLYSEMLGAGMAVPVNGLSGGPVLVGGAVVGHFSRVLGTPGAAGQPALGVVYAARASGVAALLGTAPAVTTAAAPVTFDLADRIPSVGPDEFHVFISYRSTNRPFAQALYERLNAIGFQVFMDQRELVPGDQLARSLHRALARSRCGIVLVSQAWADSPWCVAEGDALVKRAVEEAGKFRVIPLHLDAAPMHDLFASRLWIDFAGEDVPSGRKLDQVVYAVLGQAAPVEGSAEQKIHCTDTDATDEALKRIDALSKDPTRFRPLVDFLKRSGLPAEAATFRAAERLGGAGRHEEALEILPPAEQSLRARQLRTLALSRMGRHEDALALLEPTFDAGQTDAETGGILAGVYKRLWQKGNTRRYLIKSRETYDISYRASGDPYVGINVAALSLLLDDVREARRIAGAVIDDLGAKDGKTLGHWNLATLAEAYLIAGDLDSASHWYGKAVARETSLPQDVAVMRRQARLLTDHQKLERGRIDDALQVPRVVAFSGHLTDDRTRAVPRFPERKVDVVRRRIREWLMAHDGSVHAVCSAARGADITFLEEVVELSGTATVFLPFPGPDFKKASVGQGWDDRFDRILDNPHVAVRAPLLAVAPSEAEQPLAFAACNRAILDEAERMARLLDDEKPALLTVWNGGAAAGAGGTAELVEAWAARGHDHDNIDPTKP